MWTMLLLACGVLGGARTEVDLADLAPLGANELAVLKDEEHALYVSRTMLEGAQAEAERAKARVDEAQALVKQAKLEHDTAQAALDAARASGDALRIGSAEGVERSARVDLDEAEARLAWQEEALDVARSAIDLASVRIDMRKAELELARYELLAGSGRAVEYRRADFADAVEDARADYDRAEVEHQRATEAATRAWEEWRRYDQRGTY